MRKLRLRPRNSSSGNICFEFSVLCLCSVVHIWHIYNDPGFQTEVLIAKLMQIKRENPLQSLAKFYKSMAKKHNNLHPLWGWTRCENPRRLWLLGMIVDENSEDSLSVSIYSQKRMPIQICTKPTTRLLLRTVTDELMLTDTVLGYIAARTNR